MRIYRTPDANRLNVFPTANVGDNRDISAHKSIHQNPFYSSSGSVSVEHKNNSLK